MGAPVFVDISNETGQLPENVAKAYREAGGAMPIVILADPAFSKIYGTFSHAQLKGQDYRSIFRDAKRAVSTAIKEDSFNIEPGAPQTEDEPEEKVADKDDQPTEKKATPVAATKDIIRIEDPEMKSWKSNRGTTIEAKLVVVEDKKTFVLVTSKGATIRVTGEQLSLASLNEAKELAGLD